MMFHYRLVNSVTHERSKYAAIAQRNNAASGLSICVIKILFATVVHCFLSLSVHSCVCCCSYLHGKTRFPPNATHVTQGTQQTQRT